MHGIKILFVASEAAPFAFTGGLGDVMGSLPAALKKHCGGDGDIRVVLPLYRSVPEEWRKKMREVACFDVNLSWRRQYCGIKTLERDGVVYYFVDNEYYFGRDTLYGCYDDGERFAYFCMAALESMPHVGFFPDVLHANDWQSALSVIYLKTLYAGDKRYGDIKTLFTIHNIEYQGKYDLSILGDVFSLGQDHASEVEFDGCINLMKGAVVTSDAVNTVSPRYAGEIRTPEFSHGLYPVLRENSSKLCGILNGIDYTYYDPTSADDKCLSYDADNIDGKYINKESLFRKLGLVPDKKIPLLAIISRLVSHKGIDLVTKIAYNLMEQNVQLVVLGRGDERYEEFFRELERKFPNKVRAVIKYDRELSRQIYAAADIFLMPSASEPCGLAQMIASRYGAIPVVRETGGLYDSIKGYWEKDGQIMGNGFTFANYNCDEFYDRICAALSVWKCPEKRKKLVKKIMETDFSWNVSAKSYMEIYGSLTGKKSTARRENFN